ncbi:Protein Aster-A [Manis pentadactyla]|nr:Protein Aster-A [Manis pentadactyla]
MSLKKPRKGLASWGFLRSRFSDKSFEDGDGELAISSLVLSSAALARHGYSFTTTEQERGPAQPRRPPLHCCGLSPHA